MRLIGRDDDPIGQILEVLGIKRRTREKGEYSVGWTVDEQECNKSTGERWWTDLRHDEVDGHFLEKEKIGSLGVGEEGLRWSSWSLRVVPPPRKWILGCRMIRWRNGTREGSIYRTKRTRANLTYLFAASVKSEDAQMDMVTVRTVIKGLRRWFDGKRSVGYFKRKQKNPQAHGYRCSFHPGVFQSIDFPQGTWVY